MLVIHSKLFPKNSCTNDISITRTYRECLQQLMAFQTDKLRTGYSMKPGIIPLGLL